MKNSLQFDRRQFVQATALSTAALAVGRARTVLAEPSTSQVPELTNAIGIVTASAQAQLTGSAQGRNFTLLELPGILKNELDLRVVDLNTASFPDFARVDRKYLDQLRTAVSDAGCVMTNLKMNQRGIDMNSPDRQVRDKALHEYKRSIDIASQLGCRWARPLPAKPKPDMAIHVASYRELCDYAAERNVTLLVENFGWMQADADSVAKLVTAIGSNVAAGVDTGNWDSNEIRYAGLEKSFPLAVTCDFKARRFGPNGEHREYDLRRCFDIAWASGFRGPWALEYGNPDTKTLLAGFARLRDILHKWTSEKRTAGQ
ncbi:MAG: TIM barrel protein [Rhodopirellula sp.]|nr:TIM barrel protein [Rhodopirellula sp.]